MDKIFSGMHFSNNVWCRVWNEGRKKGKEEGKKDRGRDERKGRREREGERNGVESRGAAAAKSLQSCPTLCYPIDRSPPGSPVPGILQARTLEWVAISFSNAWRWKVKVKSLSCVRLYATLWTAAYQAPPSMGLSRQELLEWGAMVRLKQKLKLVGEVSADWCEVHVFGRAHAVVGW